MPKRYVRSVVRKCCACAQLLNADAQQVLRALSRSQMLCMRGNADARGLLALIRSQMQMFASADAQALRVLCRLQMMCMLANADAQALRALCRSQLMCMRANVVAPALPALTRSRMLCILAMLVHKGYVRSVVCKCCARNANADAQVLHALCRLQMLMHTCCVRSLFANAVHARKC